MKWGKTMKKKESPYIDGLDQMDIKNIESFPCFWQQCFLKRFFKKLQDENMNKNDVCNKANNNDDVKRLTANYQLLSSTLSQYTNLKNKSVRHISVDALISVSKALNVSIDYLLGIESSEQHNLTDIFEETGLTEKSIYALQQNSKAPDFINSFLQSKELTNLLRLVNQIFYSDYITKDILSAYSKSLRNIIVSAYSKYMESTLPIEMKEETFKVALCNEIKNNNITLNKEYISFNVSKDRFSQITVLSKRTNIELSQAFINDTVSCVYGILSYANSSDYYRNALSNSFSKIVDEFLTTKSEKLLKDLGNYAKLDKTDNSIDK